MTLAQKINQDYIIALKNRDSERVSVLRLCMSAIKNEAIKIGGLGTELTDQQVMSVLNREVKQHHDSVAQYTQAGRGELAQKEASEIAIIETYLPRGMAESELQQLVEQVITETGAAQKSDMGNVMASLRQKLTNPADISKAAVLVNQKLN